MANNSTFEMDASSSGRFVAFSADATNLVSGDTNGSRDVFVRDMEVGATIRASMSYLGVQAAWACDNPSISEDGLIVAFDSVDYNLAFDDTNNRSDIFVRDIVAGTTIRASLSQNGQQALEHSYDPILSSDGKSVVFVSDYSFGFSNAYGQVYHKDLLTGVLERVSVSSTGDSVGNQCELWEATYDLRFTVFRSAFFPFAYVRDRLLGRTVIASKSTGGSVASATHLSLSWDGHFAVFSTFAALDPADTNGQLDIYLHSLGDVRPTFQSLVLSPKSIRGGTPTSATAQLVNPASVFGFPADVASVNPAIASVPSILEFAPGESSRQFEVATSGVDSDIDVVISVNGSQNSVQDLLTVRRATVFSVTTALPSVVGGRQLQGTVVLDGKAGPQTALARMTDNSPHLLMSTYCVIPSNVGEANFTIWTYGVSAPTTVTISAYFNGTMKQTTLTLTPAALDVIWVVPTQVIGGSHSMGNIRLTGKAPAGGLLVTLSSSDAAAANMATTTVVSHGANLKQFPISTFGVDLTKNVTVTAVAQGITRTATLQVRPATLDRVTLEATTIQGGSATTGTVFLTGKAGPLGRTVVLNSNKAEVIVPATMYIPPQRNSWSFGVNSTVVVSSVTATISASQGGLTRVVEITVTP